MSLVAWAMCLCGFASTVAGCTGGESTPPAATTGSQTPAGDGLTIDFQSNPSPPAGGDNTFDVTVAQPDGSPVTDASVTVVFSMPAMPSMSMPAMRHEAPLTHQGSGRYSGKGELSMGGTWNVVVTVSRGTEEIGRRTFSVIAD